MSCDLSPCLARVSAPQRRTCRMCKTGGGVDSHTRSSQAVPVLWVVRYSSEHCVVLAAGACSQATVKGNRPSGSLSSIFGDGFATLYVLSRLPFSCLINQWCVCLEYVLKTECGVQSALVSVSWFKSVHRLSNFVSKCASENIHLFLPWATCFFILLQFLFLSTFLCMNIFLVYLFSYLAILIESCFHEYSYVSVLTRLCTREWDERSEIFSF